MYVFARVWPINENAELVGSRLLKMNQSTGAPLGLEMPGRVWNYGWGAEFVRVISEARLQVIAVFVLQPENRDVITGTCPSFYALYGFGIMQCCGFTTNILPLFFGSYPGKSSLLV